MRVFDRAGRATRKREAAALLMLWLIALATWYAVTGGTPQAGEVIQLFLVPVGMIFAGAFGLDWVTKQTTLAGPPMARPEDKPEDRPEETPEEKQP
ncbi:hypothetical protein NAC44_10545 [Allorhizobium sp. BGMRC 0089]|uniref:hypothetical protein n=1 Tax=Allorhizobium sonneratiae TaxID=2934936 RepID=UPI0020331FB4|nr:hypothetical protein [Allorhizobium sonneratiae]MCM2292761.1 hypothetical protein [Allorhizobium sonneratiae]